MADLDCIVQRILSSQEARVSAYAEFEGAYRLLSNGGSEDAYITQTKEVTKRFQEASTSINESISDLQKVESEDAENLVRWIRRLQTFEKEKLQRTVILHVERKRLSQMERTDEKVELDNSTAASCKSCARSVKDDENSQDDFATAIQGKKVRQLQGELEELIANINEVLDEIRHWRSEAAE